MSTRENIRLIARAPFIFPMTNVTAQSVFCTHVQNEYRKGLEMKSTSILNILARLLFEN